MSGWVSERVRECVRACVCVCARVDCSVSKSVNVLVESVPVFVGVSCRCRGAPSASFPQSMFCCVHFVFCFFPVLLPVSCRCARHSALKARAEVCPAIRQSAYLVFLFLSFFCLFFCSLASRIVSDAAGCLNCNWLFVLAPLSTQLLRFRGMPTDDSPRTRVHSGGTGLAAARELSSTNAAREAKLAGSKVSESKRVAAEAKVSHEEKVSAPSEEAESVGGAGGSREGSSSARRAAGHGEQKTQGASGRVHEEGEVMLPQTVSAQRIMDGFRIVKMNMSDAQTGEVLWESGHWEGADFEREVKASVPTRILECKEVAREITFYSKYVNNVACPVRMYPFALLALECSRNALI